MGTVMVPLVLSLAILGMAPMRVFLRWHHGSGPFVVFFSGGGGTGWYAKNAEELAWIEGLNAVEVRWERSWWRAWWDEEAMEADAAYPAAVIAYMQENYGAGVFVGASGGSGAVAGAIEYGGAAPQRVVLGGGPPWEVFASLSRPATRFAFLIGGGDATVAPGYAKAYYERVGGTWAIVPEAGHRIQATAEGRAAIQAAIGGE